MAVVDVGRAARVCESHSFSRSENPKFLAVEIVNH